MNPMHDRDAPPAPRFALSGPVRRDSRMTGPAARRVFGQGPVFLPASAPSLAHRRTPAPWPADAAIRLSQSSPLTGLPPRRL